MEVKKLINMQSDLGELVCLKDSNIHGIGLFAKQNILKDTFIHYTHGYHRRYKDWINLVPNCKYNHSKENENCEIVIEDKVIKMVASKDIREGEELLVDYTKNEILEQPQEEWIK